MENEKKRPDRTEKTRRQRKPKPPKPYQKPGRRVIEWGKNILIVLLTCSALWLANRAQFLRPINGMFQGSETVQPAAGQEDSEDRAEAARPLRAAASLPGGADLGLYGALYDTAACDTLYGQVAGVLAETLSNAETPLRIDREQWENTLESVPCVLLDFQGQIPLSVLTGWLTGEAGESDTLVRRLALAVADGRVVLAYRDEGTGNYLLSRSEVANPAHLQEGVNALSGNGAVYAFQSEVYSDLDPNTLLLADTPAPAVYAASNPESGGRASLEELIEDLSLAITSNGIYRGADDEWVARSETGTLRLSDRGVAVFETGEASTDRFLLSGGLYEQTEVCRQLVHAAMEGKIGQGRLYLRDIVQTDGGMEVNFGLSVDGIPVIPETGAAAQVVVQNGRIERMELHLRSYTRTESTSVLLPPRQAAAALRAEGLSGQEMLLSYSDTGGDLMEASWAANRPSGQE